MNNKSSAKKKVERAANVAIIVVAATLCFVIVRTFVNRAGERSKVPSIPVGTSLQKAGLDCCSNSKHTLVVYLQKGCQYCSKSAPFYRRLILRSSHNDDFHLVAVLPQPVEEGREYLDSLGIYITDIRQVEPSVLGVAGTPTLILTNERGTVEESWEGILSPENEGAILNKITGRNL